MRDRVFFERSLLARALLLVWCAAAYAANQYVFSTNPPTAGASVFVDGTYVGSTDENGKVVISKTEPGVHLIRIECGGESYTAEVPFDADLNSLPPFDLGTPCGEKKEVDYRIDTNVAAAAVIVDGVSRGQTDNGGRSLLRLSAGQAHIVKIRKPGFAEQSQSVVPTDGGELKLTLQPLTTESRIDVVLVSLVMLLTGSVVLLLLLVMRHRVRPIAMPHYE